MSKILVTGGCGYIGSHTVVDLIENGYEVISVDNNTNSTPRMMEGVEKITGKKIKNYKVDLCNFDDTFAIFQENTDIIGIIHFAAFKWVGESVEQPLKYFDNNLNSLLNILRCAEEFKVRHIVFSSSCSVYGNTKVLPVDESAPLLEAQSPYARTKQMGEAICRDFTNRFKDHTVILLRYFNPVGAHPSGIIGEIQPKPENLVPYITQTAVGKLPQLTVFGDDYPTRDGSCIRDYIHVMDIANAHTLALKHSLSRQNTSNCEVFNLGSGNGTSVLELINAFEKVSGQTLNYSIGARRPGDVIAIYADNTKARKYLGWNPIYTVEDMMATAWKWELRLKTDEKFYSGKPSELN